MALNIEAVGTVGAPTAVTWTSADTLLYAVSLGMGSDDLPFSTENSSGIEQLVFPTFPVVVGWDLDEALAGIGEFDPAMLVHGRQSVTLHQPLRPAATVTLHRSIPAMYDKGKAAVVVTQIDASDQSGEPVYSTSSWLFIRGAGGWGGDRGPSGPVTIPPDRAPDHCETYTTSRDQAFVYRLNGDRNPLHTDPLFAARGGFERPILHGLCTYGVTARALVSRVCDGDPERFRHIDGRFTSPVIPGESLTVQIWQTGDREATFVTSVDERTVIDQGLFTFS